MLDCEICGNEFDEGICMDCEADLRAAAERTPLELAAGEMYKALIRIGKEGKRDNGQYDKYDARGFVRIAEDTLVKFQDNPSPQANLSEQDEHKSAP